MRALHDLNPVRLQYVEQPRPLAGLRVVDVGCGGGLLAEAMARKGARVTGLDLADDLLQVAKLHALDAGVEVDYVLESAETHTVTHAAQYDVVTCMEMLEHVPDPGSVVRACSQLVKPGGWVFFSTINRNPKAFLFAIVGAEYVMNLLPRGTHEYLKFIKPSELGGWCRQARLDLLQTQGMEYNPLTRRYWLSADTSVNYLAAARKT